jgi:hypothetical protein
MLPTSICATNVTGRKFDRVTKIGQRKTACIFLLDWQKIFVKSWQHSTRPSKQVDSVKMLVTTSTLVFLSKSLLAAHSIMSLPLFSWRKSDFLVRKLHEAFIALTIVVQYTKRLDTVCLRHSRIINIDDNAHE